MRDYIVLAIVFLSVPLAVLSPYYGLLVWSWLAYFNPHRYGWGIARDFPVALVIAIPTIVGMLFAKKNKHTVTRESSLLLLLWAWFAFTTIYISYVPVFAGHVVDAQFHLREISKILLMTIATILLVTNRDKLHIMVMVIAGSFGFRALIAAIFFIQTAGQYRIWGPDGTFIADNNDFGLALNMSIPLLFFLAQDEPRKWIRVCLRVLTVGTIISVIGTYSRGGALGLAVVIGALLMKSRHKVLSVFVVAAGLFLVVGMSSNEWKGRMDDFMHGKMDQSAESRLATWHGGWRLALDYPLTGGGFDAYPDGNLMVRYIPGSRLDTAFKGPHSIYLQMLGEQGFVGLGLFLALLISCFAALRKIRRAARRYDALKWAVPYTQMFEVSLLAYTVSGATLGRAYFDFMYQIIACVIVLKILFEREYHMLGTEDASGTPEVYEESFLAGAAIA